MSRCRDLSRRVALILVIGVGIACAPNPQYPYEKEPDPRKDKGSVSQLADAYEITVFGSVESPGTFSPKRFVTVLEAIDLAGGLAPRADGNNIVIERKGRQIPFVYDRVTSGSRPEMNIVVMPGDIIQVP